MTNTSLFDISVHADGAAVAVLLNGIALPPAGDAAPPWHLSLNEYLSAGNNHLAVTLSPIPGFELEPSALIEINQNGAPVCVLTYPPPIDPAEPLPQTLEDDFEFDAAIGPRAWESATPVDDAGAPPESLIAFLRRVEQTLQSHDVDGAMALFAVKTRELAGVFGLDPDAQLADKREYFAGLFRDPFFGMEPVDAANVRIRSLAGGRMVWVHARYGRHPLRTVPDAEGIVSFFPVVVSLIQNEWVIVL